MIDKYKNKYKELVAKQKCANYHTKCCRGVGIVTQLICKRDNLLCQKSYKNT